MSDPVKNFAISSIDSFGGTGDTELTLPAGFAAKFPDPAAEGQFNVVIWNDSDYKNPSEDPDVQIARVQSVAGDVLTVEFGQEDTSDAFAPVGGKDYRMMQAFTKKAYDDLGEKNIVISSILAGGTIAAGDVVGLDEGAGRWVKLEDVLTGGEVIIGIALGSSTNGQPIEVLRVGEISDDSFVFGGAGKPLYVDPASSSLVTSPTFLDVGSIFSVGNETVFVEGLRKVIYAPPTAYFSGGNAADTEVAITDGLLFATDTTTQTTRGALSQARTGLAGAASPTTAYFSGGNTASGGGSRVTTTDGLLFATDTTTQTTRGALSQARSGLAGAASPTTAYFSGGLTSGGKVTTTDGLLFATDTTTQTTRGALSQARDDLAGAAKATPSFL